MWPFARRRPACASPDAEAAAEQAERALADAKRLHAKVDRVAKEAAEIKRVNHIAAAMARAIKGV